MKMLQHRVVRVWIGNALAVLIGLVVSGLVFAGAEAALYFREKLFSPPELVFSGRGTVKGASVLGWELERNGTVWNRADRGGRTIYDVLAKTDGAGRRQTPCAPRGEDARIAAFFGCSMTFGQGVADEETIPSRFCAHKPGWTSHNYGVYAYGPQQMWLQICRQEVLREFSERKGVVIYSFIQNHLQRLVGASSVHSEWIESLPWLEVNDGRIVHRGFFSDRPHFQSLIVRSLARTRLAGLMAGRLPGLPGLESRQKSGLDLLVTLVAECVKSAREQAPGLEFCCVLLPECSEPWREVLSRRLSEAGVRVLDYETLFAGLGEPMEEVFFDDTRRKNWGHFKARGCDLIARQLARDIAE